ncbi:hypothetical protein F5887DRAFT_1030099 [Amanita rubescens]|nr:hypothetical protein F5887DRAFT_1030099 [Amanita rubescens]
MSTDEDSAFSDVPAKVESQPDAAVNPNPFAINLLAFSTIQIVAFSIPTFHASLATSRVVDSTLDLKATLPVWEALRNFASILLAAVVAASFKAQVNPGYWFFITCSLLQGSLALISSTILIISFSGNHREHEYRFVDVNPTTGTCTFIIALVIDTLWPKAVVRRFHPTTVKIMLCIVMFLSAVRFVFFMLHLRRVVQARLGEAELT